MLVESVKPVWLQNYKPGYVGFVSRLNNVVSLGIGLLQKESDVKGIKVSHTFMVVDRDVCIEASSRGVIFTNITKYFSNPEVLVMFKKPRLYDKEQVHKVFIPYAAGIVADKVGYDYLLLFGQVLDSFVTHKGKRRVMPEHENPIRCKSRMICSQLIARILKTGHLYKVLGVLAQWAESRITPQMLFEDRALFEPWEFKDEAGL